MFAIKSKKTGNTYLRAHPGGIWDWCMFREERPREFDTESAAKDYINSHPFLKPEDCEVILLLSVPLADPAPGVLNLGQSLLPVTEDKASPYKVQIGRYKTHIHIDVELVNLGLKGSAMRENPTKTWVMVHPLRRNRSEECPADWTEEQVIGQLKKWIKLALVEIVEEMRAEEENAGRLFLEEKAGEVLPTEPKSTNVS